MNSPASAADLRRYGLEPREGSLFGIRNCQCSQEYIIECRGPRVPERKVKSECPFCHGPLAFKSEYDQVDFHFDKDHS